MMRSNSVGLLIFLVAMLNWGVGYFFGYMHAEKEFNTHDQVTIRTSERTGTN
jgi:hypothetical protein